jgi:hypothetical protein
VNVSGTSKITTSTSVDIRLVSGTYNVSVSTSSDYNITLSSSSVTINNANTTVNVVFNNITTPSKVTNSGTIYGGALGWGCCGGSRWNTWHYDVFWNMDLQEIQEGKGRNPVKSLKNFF